MARLDTYINGPADYIVESSDRLQAFDINQIKNTIRHPRNVSFTLRSYQEVEDFDRRVEAIWKSPFLTFYYNADFYELTNFLVDFCDENDLMFKSDFEKPSNTQYFKIRIEKK